MPADRKPSTFNEDDITSELMYLQRVMTDPKSFPQVPRIRDATIENDRDQRKVGKFKSEKDRRSVTKGAELLEGWFTQHKKIPTFLVAGPRDQIAFKEKTPVRAAIVTTGGSAPGLNRVIHSIVQRHDAYGKERRGKIWGVQDSFLGMCNFVNHRVALEWEETEKWIDRGGSMLGMRRERGPKSGDDLPPEELASKVLAELQNKRID